MNSLDELKSELRPPEPAPTLPAWTNADVFCSVEHPAPPEIIHQVLHQGCKMVIGGPSKARKSWLLMDLALSVATGTPWLNIPTTAAQVLYVNFELPEFAVHTRIKAIAAAKGISIPQGGQLVFWNLRGHAASYITIIPQICAQIRDAGFGLVILDPIYKLLGRADENSAGDTAQLLNTFEWLTVQTKAAIAFSAHFAKGNASSKESIDRISGSGVFARDPDVVLTLTALETPDAYAIEPILRTFAPYPPFSVRWEYPLMRCDDQLDPAALKRPASRPAKRKPAADEVLALFKSEPKTPREGLKTAVEMRDAFRVRGWDEACAPAMRDTLEGQGRLRVWHGPHNQKLCGLPTVVEAYEAERNQAGTLLEQPALPVGSNRKRKNL